MNKGDIIIAMHHSGEACTIDAFTEVFVEDCNQGIATLADISRRYFTCTLTYSFFCGREHFLHVKCNMGTAVTITLGASQSEFPIRWLPGLGPSIAQEIVKSAYHTLEKMASEAS